MRNFYSFGKAKGLIKKAAVFSSIMLTGFIAQALPGGTYTIDANGTASSTNFRNFTSFFNTLMNNTRTDGGPLLGSGVSGGPVIVHVVPNSGPYTEQLNVSQISGMDATNHVRIFGNGNILQFTATTTNRHVFRLNGIDYLSVSNLVIRSTASAAGWNLHLMNGSNYNTFDSCLIDYTALTSQTTNAVGICISNSTTSPTSIGNAGNFDTFRNCTIKGRAQAGPYYAITNQGPSGTLTHNTFENNNIEDFYLYGIWGNYCGGTRVIGNRISRPTITAHTTCYAMYFINGSRQETITGNYIFNLRATNPNVTSTTFGIAFATPNTPYGQETRVTNNVVSFNHNGTTYGFYSTCGSNIYIENNTVSDVYPSSSFNTTYGALHQICTYTNFRSVNNIFFTNRLTSGINYGQMFSTGNSAVSNDVKVDGNVYLISGSTNQNYVVNDNGNTYNTFAQWRAAGGDPKGAAANPNFTNPAIGDFKPRSLDIDDIGVANGVTTDILRVNRNLAAPDPGAFEFTVDVKVVKVELPTTNICQANGYPVKVWIKNNASFPVSNVRVSFKVNEEQRANEIAGVSINPGDSIDYTFNTLAVFSNVGNGQMLKGFVSTKSDTSFQAINVAASPVGSMIVKGSSFAGAFNAGDLISPDIVAHGDKITYEYTQPNNYTNSQYGSGWRVSSISITTLNGTAINSADTASFIPTTSTNGRVEITPRPGESDSTFRVSIKLRNVISGCDAPEMVRYFFVAPRPNVVYNVANVCLGDKAEFFNSTSISSGQVSYQWDLGNGVTTDAPNPTIFYTAPGQYVTKLIATSDYGYRDSMSITVTVFEKPNAEFTFVNQCEGAAIPFTDQSTLPSGVATYEWNFGDNSSISTSNNPTHQYNNPGIYPVSLKVTDNGCSDVRTKYVTYAHRAAVDFTYTANKCSSEPVSFTNTSTLASGSIGYIWKLGDGFVAQNKDITYKYSSYNTYDVTLIGTTNFGCVDSVTKTVMLVEAPVVDFSTVGNCSGDAVSFNNLTTISSGNLTHAWEFGDGRTSNNANPTHNFGRAGNFNVTLTVVADNGCFDEITKVVNFGVKPVAFFVTKTDICLGEENTFLNGSTFAGGNLNYDWSFDGTNSSNASNPAFTYTVPGTYNASLIVTTPENCSDTASITINVKEIPNSAFTAVSNLDGNGTYRFTPADPSSGDFLWLFGDGTTSNVAGVVTHRYFEASIFKPTLVVTKDGCQSSTSTEIIVNALSTVDPISNQIINYPNPSTGMIKLENKGNVDLGNVSIKVVDQLGRFVSEFNWNTSVSPSTVIDLSNFAAGIYHLQISNGEFVSNRKVEIIK